MPIPLLVVGGAAALAKGASVVWFGSRATSPLSVPWRIEFLDRFEVEIPIIEKMKDVTEDEVASLKADLALLREHVKEGWGDSKVFDAASRIAYFRSKKHTISGLSGFGSLLSSYGGRVNESAEGYAQRANESVEAFAKRINENAEEFAKRAEEQVGTYVSNTVDSVASYAKEADKRVAAWVDSLFGPKPPQDGAPQ